MRTIIAGGRDINDHEALRKAIDASGFEIGQVVSGGATGIDRLGIWWAMSTGRSHIVFPADWKAHGRAAGPIRNRRMAEYAEALIAIWDGKSRGTKNMIDEARKRGLNVYVHRVNAPTPSESMNDTS